MPVGAIKKEVARLERNLKRSKAMKGLIDSKDVDDFLKSAKAIAAGSVKTAQSLAKVPIHK